MDTSLDPEPTANRLALSMLNRHGFASQASTSFGGAGHSFMFGASPFQPEMSEGEP